MKGGLKLFIIIGIFIFTFITTNANSKTTIYKLIDDNMNNIPRKNDLVGKYVVKSDKKSTLTLNNDGTYNLMINVCNNYLLLTGNYELRNSKLVLNNKENSYDDLNNNLELNITIIDSNTLKVDENLVCTEQGTLFEK